MHILPMNSKISHDIIYPTIPNYAIETYIYENWDNSIYNIYWDIPWIIHIYIYPPTPAFAKAGAAPGTTGGVDPVFLEPLPRPTLQAKATTRPQQWLKSTPRPQQWLLL